MSSVRRTNFHPPQQKGTHAQFFQNLKCLATQLEPLLVFVTDGESALSDALSDSFPSATYLRCSFYFRKKHRGWAFVPRRKGAQQYIEYSFGRQERAFHEMGFLDATSEDMFHAVLASLQEPWARREQKECGTSSFHNWMLHRARMMKESMIASFRTKAGLGYRPDKFYTNDSENINRRLRHKTGEKELGETAFAKAVRELIEDEQETELVLAVFNGSEFYQIKEPFNKFQISRDERFAMKGSNGRRKKKVSILLI